MTFNLSQIPTIKLPLIDLTTNPFDLLLAGLGLRLQLLARTNAKFMGMIHGRNFTLQLGSNDGVARHFHIHDDTVTMGAGPAEKADFILRFKDSETAVKTLLKGDPAAFMEGMQSGAIVMEGDFSLLLWFNGVAKLIVPQVPKPLKARFRQVKDFVNEKRDAFAAR